MSGHCQEQGQMWSRWHKALKRDPDPAEQRYKDSAHRKPEERPHFTAENLTDPQSDSALGRQESDTPS